MAKGDALWRSRGGIGKELGGGGELGCGGDWVEGDDGLGKCRQNRIASCHH